MANFSLNFDLHSSYLVPSDYSVSGNFSPNKKCASIWSYNPIEEEYQLIEEPTPASPLESRPRQLMPALVTKRSSESSSDSEHQKSELAQYLQQNSYNCKTPKKQTQYPQLQSPKGDSNEEIRWDTIQF